jgi:hypothetical protein
MFSKCKLRGLHMQYLALIKILQVLNRDDTKSKSSGYFSIGINTDASQPGLLPEEVFNGILYLKANP